jgi:two-component system, OmpR family, sensor histidine kinase CiaH
MFRSARLKLTVFYLAAIIFMSLTLTLGTRWVAEQAYNHGNNAEQPGLRALIRREIGLPLSGPTLGRFENQQQQHVVSQLNEYVIYINVVALLIGGMVSYWYAGRTLKPIEEAHAAQARFASDASHELRTPLTAIRTENEVFLRQPKTNSTEARDQIASNLEEVQRLEQLAANLLALSDFEEGKPLSVSELSAKTLAEQAQENIRKLHPDITERLETRVAEAKFMGNGESLAQVLTIFLDNAIKYSPKNQAIKLVGALKGNNYNFDVIDNGPGIDLTDMPHIFERLYRGDKSRASKVAGHGLGLSLAKEIARANNAGLSVANRKGGGAKFTLSLEKA